ncbi:hypothetical protein TNCV_1445051 [Trichonephila clavipes]|nr:hypothetical protein TNCV_1445051 [Trichonephila clavipes]
MQHIRSRCERVRWPGTLNNDARSAPKRSLTTPSRGLKTFHTSYENEKYAEGKRAGGRKLLRGIVRQKLRGFVHNGCVFRGRDEYPVCGKSARSNSCSQKYYDRCCRSILQCC